MLQLCLQSRRSSLVLCILFATTATCDDPTPLHDLQFARLAKAQIRSEAEQPNSKDRPRWPDTLSTAAEAPLPNSVRRAFAAEEVLARPRVCPTCTAPLLLVLGIVSSRSHAAERQAARDTWLRGHTPDPGACACGPGEMVFRFLVGHQEDDGLAPALAAEQAEHADLLFVPVVDTYRNILLKVVRFADWTVATRRRGFLFWMKVDDDTFVRLTPLLADLAQRPPPRRRRTYRGHVWTGRPVRDPAHKNHLSANAYPLGVLPPYVHGAAYVLTSDLVSYIALNANLLAAGLPRDEGGVEDPLVGMWLMALGVKPEHDWRFVDHALCHRFALVVTDVPSECLHKIQRCPDFERCGCTCLRESAAAGFATDVLRFRHRDGEDGHGDGGLPHHNGARAQTFNSLGVQLALLGRVGEAGAAFRAGLLELPPPGGSDKEEVEEIMSARHVVQANLNFLCRAAGYASDGQDCLLRHLTHVNHDNDDGDDNIAVLLDSESDEAATFLRTSFEDGVMRSAAQVSVPIFSPASALDFEFVEAKKHSAA